MSVTIEAAPMAAEAEVVNVSVNTNTKIYFNQALSHYGEGVASVVRLSIGGTSLSAVAPDNYFGEDAALAAA